MTLRHWLLSLCMLTGATVLVTVTTAQDVPAPPLPNAPGTKPLEQEKGIQVENRGPVHEAFANPAAPGARQGGSLCPQSSTASRARTATRGKTLR